MRIIRVEHGGTAYYGVLEDGLVFRLHKQPGHMEPNPAFRGEGASFGNAFQGHLCRAQLQGAR